MHSPLPETPALIIPFLSERFIGINFLKNVLTTVPAYIMPLLAWFDS